MKKWILTLAMTAIVGIGFAQQFEAPRDGAKIHLSTYELDLESTGEATLDLWIVRSKRARKSNFDTPKFLGTNDLSIKLEQDPNDANHFVVAVKTEGVASGKYFYTVASRSRSVQKVKGTTVTFNVGKPKAVTKNN